MTIPLFENRFVKTKSYRCRRFRRNHEACSYTSRLRRQGELVSKQVTVFLLYYGLVTQQLFSHAPLPVRHDRLPAKHSTRTYSPHPAVGQISASRYSSRHREPIRRRSPAKGNPRLTR